MRPTERVESSTQLKLSDIEKGLSSLWGKAAGEPAPPEIRVCTLSLVVYVPDENAQASASKAVDSAVQSHPLRAIYMRTEPEASEHTSHGQVSGMCQVTETGNIRICCEQILVVAKGRAVDELPASVSNLLIPDLPVALWWMDEPEFDQSIFEHLELVSDFLILDSQDFADPLRGLRDMVKNLDKHSHIIPNDLNWLRLNAWRESTASLFDKPERLPCLDQISRVEIEYTAHDQPNPLQALLFTGWLGSRLNWLTNPTTNSQTPTAASQPPASDCLLLTAGNIQISIKPMAESETGDGNLSAVKIETLEGKETFSLNYSDGEIRAQALSDAKIVDEYCNPWQPESMVAEKMLAVELEALWPDPIYVDALCAAAKLVGRS